MSRDGDGKPHVLVFPYPAQGHLIPLLDLTHQLCLRNLTITILVTPKNLSALHPLLSLHPTIQPLVFPFPPHPDLSPGVENVSDVGNRGNVPIINALSKLRDPIIQWFKSHHNPPVAIVSDFFLGWTLQLANQLEIPRVSFFSSGPFLASVLVHCWRNASTFHALPVVEFQELPRAPSFKEEHLPSSFRYYNESNPEFQIIKEANIANSQSWGAVFNSFDALEGEYFQHWRTKLGNFPHRVYGVGPLTLMGLTERLDRGNPNPGTDAEIIAWLNGCPDGSVVYVCFGSQKLLNKQQMEALASGLEQSKTRFLWVVKRGTARQVDDGYGVVPDGFEERVGGRGLVVKTWAPQRVILSHRAVGGFLSHCGWNSTLEAIVAGVMILGWPMEADQFVNARLLVDNMGAAVRLCEGGDTVPDSADLGMVIAESMSVDRPEKLKAKELKDKAFAAVKEGGSSSKDLAEFVKDLEQLQIKNRLI